MFFLQVAKAEAGGKTVTSRQRKKILQDIEVLGGGGGDELIISPYSGVVVVVGIVHFIVHFKS